MHKLDRSTFLVSRTFIFDAAHHLEGYQGKCSYVHGHRYELTITYEAAQGPDGIALDFVKLKDHVQEHIIDYLDHHDLNEILDMSNPTAENICLWCYYRLVPTLESIGWLYSIELKEGRDTKVTLLRDRVGYIGGHAQEKENHR